MQLLKKLVITATVTAALTVTAPAAYAIATTAIGAPSEHVVAGSTRLGPFANRAECESSRREWDISHTVSTCKEETFDGRKGWYFFAW